MIAKWTAAALLLAGTLAAVAGDARSDPVQASGAVRGEVGRLTLSWPAPVSFEARSTGGRHVLRFARPIEADFAAAIAPLNRFIGMPEVGDDGRSVAFPLKPGIVALTFADKTRVMVDLFAGFPPPVVAAQEDPTHAVAVPGGAIKPPVPAPNRRAQAQATAGSASSADADDARQPALRFEWSEPAAAAAFRRAGALWLIFDRPSAQDVARLEAAAGEAVRAIEQRAHPRATVLRLELAGDVGAALRRDGLAWLLILGARNQEPASSAEPELRQDPDGAALVLPVAEPGTPVVLTDPAVGDTLVVVPVVPLGHGLAREHGYPEVRLLPSLQGLVVRPLVDDLVVRPAREALELLRPGGLTLTPVGADTLARARVRAAAPGDRLLQLEGWAAVPIGAYTSARQALEATLAAAATAAEREPAWLRLASLNLAQGLAAETLGALERAREARPAIADGARFRAMRGAALLLLGRLADADAELGQAALTGHPEAAAWRTAVAVARGRGADNQQGLDEQAAIVAGYPRILRRALLPVLAEAAIDAGQPALAEKLLELLAAEAEGPAATAAVTFLEGRRLAADGDVPGALGKWREVEAGLDPERRSQVRAEYASIDLALAKQRMAPREAIGALDALSFAWRGDALELSILRRLGELHLAEGDLASALRTFKRAATSFPLAMQTDDIPAKMTDAFAALFVGENAARLTPLQAIALYDEFRELTPADPRGDRIVEAVVEQMVELDLLGRATSLLESQVRFRLTGAVRAAAGARLASLHLLEDKPEAALKAVEATAEANLPGVLARDRQIIAARALVRLGRAREALSRLEAVEVPEAWAVRADACWRLGAWPQAARWLEKTLAAGRRNDAGGADGSTAVAGRSEALVDRVLHLAVALALAGDEAGLERLDEAEGAAMAQSRWKDVFPLIVTNSVAAADLQALAADAGPVDHFRAYLAADAVGNRGGGPAAEDR